VYFSSQAYAGLGLSINAALVAGGPVTTLWSGSPPPGAVNCMMRLALDGTTVYWLPHCTGEGGCELPGGWLRKAPLTGGPSITLLSDLLDEELLAVDDTYAYVALNPDPNCYSWGTPGLLRVPIDGGAREWLTHGFVFSVAVDGDRVYWSEKDRLFAKPKLGGAVTVLDRVTATALALDEVAVYYSDVDGAALKRVNKPRQ